MAPGELKCTIYDVYNKIRTLIQVMHIMAHDHIDYKHDNLWNAVHDCIVFNMIIIITIMYIQECAILNLYRHR